ncbi:MAG: sugar phosphate isomerase/epimerase [archaeon]|nr:sugar phosphate isomerase/epimerase [archaeon]
MKHLVNYSIYSKSGKYPRLIHGDGLELLTGYSDLNPSAWPKAFAVHLPYATDWYSVWSGKTKTYDDQVLFTHYGKDRESIIDAIRTGIRCATRLKPAYGVIHAGSVNLNELLDDKYSDTDQEVLAALAEIINTVVSEYTSGEPPFRIHFENQWWPGLKLLDDKNFRFLCNKLEFDNWGLCLDIGHLLVTTQKSENELQAINLLSEIFQNYSSDMIDAVKTIHLHYNNSSGYIRRYDKTKFHDLPYTERLKVAYKFVCDMDMHRPWSIKDVRKITDIFKPDFITHEMGTSGEKFQKDYEQQRSLFV